MVVIEVTFCSKISPSPRNRHKKTRNCFVYAWQTFWILYTNVLILSKIPKNHIITKLPISNVFLMIFIKNKTFLPTLHKVFLTWTKQFRIFQCQFKGDRLALEQKVTSMTPIEIKSYLLGAIFRPFFWVLGAKKPIRAFFWDTLYILCFPLCIDVEVYKYLEIVHVSAHITITKVCM